MVWHEGAGEDRSRRQMVLLTRHDDPARDTRLPDGAIVPERFDNTSVTVLHEDAPHRIGLINCTRHLATSIQIDRMGGEA